MKRRLLISILVLGLAVLVGAWLTGTILIAPAQQAVGDPPANLPAKDVEFESQSGAIIKGWFIRGKVGAGAVILMHGVRANRLSMVNRARFLSDAGFSVLLFDFQAHGESSGKQVTFGYLESKDAQSAVPFLRSSVGNERIGVIGVSMGGTATLLASPSLDVNAMVLEMVYPTLEEAVSNRLSMRLGAWARILTPLLTWQLRVRTGVGADTLRPLNRVAQITVPKLFICGGEDRHTTVQESRHMFNAAGEPKQLWIVEGATHTDLHEVRKDEYEYRVLSFFAAQLKQR